MYLTKDLDHKKLKPIKILSWIQRGLGLPKHQSDITFTETNRSVIISLKVKLFNYLNVYVFFFYFQSLIRHSEFSKLIFYFSMYFPSPPSFSFHSHVLHICLFAYILHRHAYKQHNQPLHQYNFIWLYQKIEYVNSSKIHRNWNTTNTIKKMFFY